MHWQEQGNANTCGLVYLLLGLNRGHLPEYEELVSLKDLKTRNKHWVSLTNTAVSQIVPSWHITRLLDNPKLIQQQATAHAEFMKNMQDIKEDGT